MRGDPAARPRRPRGSAPPRRPTASDCGRASRRIATIGCRRKPLTGMSSGVSAPSTRTSSSGSADLLVRLAQRRLLEGLARIDDAAGQRHLAAMAQRLGAHGEDDVRLSRSTERGDREDAKDSSASGGLAILRFVCRWKDQQQAAASRMRAGLKPAGHSRRGTGASRACASAPGSVWRSPGSRATREAFTRVWRRTRHRAGAAVADRRARDSRRSRVTERWSCRRSCFAARDTSWR